MTLSQRNPMSGCGKPYATEAAAMCSKRGRAGGLTAVLCRCKSWHLRDATEIVLPDRRTARPDTFSAAVRAQLDKRDGCCQNCGSTQGLQRHHRRGKASGGSSRRAHTHCSCNGLILCWRCHPWSHVRGRRQAQAQGFVVSQSVAEPASIGVMRYAGTGGGGATQWPTCGGTWAGSAPEARETAVAR